MKKGERFLHALSLWVRSKPPVISLAEREYRTERSFREHPIGNDTLWALLTLKTGGLSETEVSRIVDAWKTFKGINAAENTPLSELAETAGVKGLEKDRFFQRVCFNYDETRGVEEREKQAVEQLHSGERESISGDDHTLWTVERMVQYDFSKIIRQRFVFRHDQFDGITKSAIAIFLPDRGGLSEDHLLRLKDKYEKEALPFLMEGELIKPGRFAGLIFSPPTPPRIAKRFNDPA